jgi:hypothetical protein
MIKALHFQAENQAPIRKGLTGNDSKNIYSFG